MVFNYLLPVILANQGWPSQNYFFWSGLRTVKKSCAKNALIIVRIVNASLTSMMREKKKLDCQMICFYRKECFCNLNFSITLANCVRGLRRRLACYISNKITNWQTTAQCPRCQIGCSCSNNLPGSNYRRLICSCSYYIEHPKILLYELLEQIILRYQKPKYAPGCCYRSILFSCSCYTKHILLKVTKLEFENNKNKYFSWLLRSEHVKTNIFGNRMTKLTI